MCLFASQIKDTNWLTFKKCMTHPWSWAWFLTSRYRQVHSPRKALSSLVSHLRLGEQFFFDWAIICLPVTSTHVFWFSTMSNWEPGNPFLSSEPSMLPTSLRKLSLTPGVHSPGRWGLTGSSVLEAPLVLSMSSWLQPLHSEGSAPLWHSPLHLL